MGVKQGPPQATKLLSAQMQPEPKPEAGAADFTLHIAPVIVELAPGRAISTIGYNGTSPGPLLRMREGTPVTVDVVNETDIPELVHWHGQLIPSEVTARRGRHHCDSSRFS